jgi:hypothetical protein
VMSSTPSVGPPPVQDLDDDLVDLTLVGQT